MPITAARSANNCIKLRHQPGAGEQLIGPELQARHVAAVRLNGLQHFHVGRHLLAALHGRCCRWLLLQQTRGDGERTEAQRR